MQQTSKLIRFVMIGGFLGAGKTTAMARVARHYMASGNNVGLITNDQAYGLVDTESLRAQGFHVDEVPGACFCCKFDDLLATIDRLGADQRPDVIVTEPVGSCTDLMATVVEPLRHLHGDQFDIGPLVVLLKPEHGQKILDGTSGAGFSPKAQYIFLKQIEEADLVVLNKVDKLSSAESARLTGLVQTRFNGKEVLAASAKTGAGFDEVLKRLDQPAMKNRQTMDVDYETYAAGEAELGWLNGTANLAFESDAAGSFSLDALLVEFVESLRQALEAMRAEPGHLKVLARSEGHTAIANLVGGGEAAELSVESGAQCKSAELIINARVATDPEPLAEVVEKELIALAQNNGLRCHLGTFQKFRPAPPVPTHRMQRGG